MDQDIRWRQRLAHYRKAFAKLDSAVELSKTRKLSELEQQGLIQAFEFTHELAWNLMKDWFEYQGNNTLTGSRDAIREAFKAGLVEDGDGWMQTIRSRNESSHTYNQELADSLTAAILDRYWSLFRAFIDVMTIKEQEE
jgi:nucleotidyltransferase substrate binding protein (TIGR01987 family)